MLSVLNRYAHGFVAVPVLVAFRERRAFELLRRPSSLEALAAETGGNTGHLQAALRMIQSMGWVTRDGAGRYAVTEAAQACQRIPSQVLELLELPADAYLRSDGQEERLRPWLAWSRERWRLGDPLLADMLDGLLVLPILNGIHRAGLRDEMKPGSAWFSSLSPRIRDELRELFLAMRWARGSKDCLTLEEAGDFIVQRALITGTTVSYAPMLARMPTLLFGDARRAFAPESSGVERHVDRALNVVASGFQHEKFFADVDDVILSIFDRQPVEAQPKYLIDMGCGDGMLLKRIHETIRERSLRGRVLEQHPLWLIGVDLNQTALEITERNLAGIPHLVMRGDIGDPERMMADLRARGLEDIERCLHVRSFLDHDRPYAPPRDAEAVRARARLPYRGVYVDQSGALIPPEQMVQSLVEHLRRWSSVVNEHGLILLEVHCLEPELVERHLDRSENLHFDAYHAFSRQYLVEASVFLMSAAEAGLFPKAGFSRRYPRTLPFTRITLNTFERRPYTVRHPRLEDLEALSSLEEAALPSNLRASPRELRERLERAPDGQFALELDGRIVACAYSQRISRVEVLEHARYAAVSALHVPDGPVIQLLGLNVLPEVQHLGLGDQLLEFVLQHSALRSNVEHVAGMTRCRHFVDQKHLTMEEYVHARNGQGQALDPILRFHQEHGARLRGVVPGYRPEDADNQGFGVLIEYELRTRARGSAGAESVSERPRGGTGSGAGQSPSAVLEESIRTILGPRRESAFSPRRPLREMGLDSLDLMELASLLGRQLGRDLEPTFFFQYGTAEAIAAFLQKEGGQARGGLAPVEAPLERRRSRASSPPPEVSLQPEPAVSAREPRAVVTPDEPVAIIGMSCRFPGGGSSPDAFWALLREGRDAISEVPAARRELLSTVSPAGEPTGERVPRYGGFLEQVDQFDAPFFRIAPREAVQVDPQQRLLLEVSWEALENAGLAPDAMAGSPVGVFTGIFSHDYELLQVRRQQESDLGVYFATGASNAVASGRISYFFGFEGPSLAVNTACSSSLVSVHLACQSLRRGECELALATGVNLLLAPELSTAFSQAGMLSPEGRCKTFDASADGYVRSEGCAAVVLKRLSRALADGDPILAVVRGSAINQDGASNGLTAPNGLAQEALIRKALADAKLAPSEVGYVEAHGTGTSLGDPVEVQALAAVYGEGRTPEQPLVIGSVKTNIGHTEAAAGLAGLIKVVLSLGHEYIPRHLHLQQVNPRMPLEGIPALIPNQGLPWPRASGRRRLAGVSSFGFSGTNCHVILEEAPARLPVEPSDELPGHLLALSARSEQGLVELARAYEATLEAHPELPLADLCFTANSGRAHFEHRMAFVAESTPWLREQLAQVRSGAGEPTARSRGPVPSRGLEQIAFLFTGQGSQYVGMARELFELQPVFRERLEEGDEILRERLPRPLLEIIHDGPREGASLDETIYTQPALFCVEVALAELWRSWGIQPTAVMGHSLGEYAAACVAGVFSFEEGLKLVAERARLMQALPAGGEMMAVHASPEQVLPVVNASAGAVSVAAFNGPRSLVLSGHRDAVREVVAELARQGLKASQLRVSHAFHSALMEPMLAEFERAASRVSFRSPGIALISNLTGALATEEIRTPAYWRRHVRESVRFSEGMEALHRLGHRTFIEVGPKPVLLGMGQQCLPEVEARWLPSLAPGRSDWQQLLRSVAELYASGATLRWAALETGFSRRKVALPTYPFQRQRYWLSPSTGGARGEARSSRPSRGRGEHPLRGRRLRSCLEELQFESTIAADAPAYLAEHCVHEQVVLPGAAYLEVALAAGASAFKSEGFVLSEVIFQQAMLLPAGEARRLQTVLTPDGDGAYTFRVCSSQDQEPEVEEAPPWIVHTTGRLVAHSVLERPAREDLLSPRRGRRLAGEDFYRQVHERNIQYGPCFRAIEELWLGEGEALARIRLPQELVPDQAHYRLHPALLDACLQVVYGAFTQGTYMPVSLERLAVHGRLGEALWSRARVRAVAGSTGETFTADLRMLSPEGELLAVVEGLLFKRVSRDVLMGVGAPAWMRWLYEVEWREQQAPAPVTARDSGGSLEGLREALSARLLGWAEEQGLAAQEEWLAQVENLGADYVKDALEQLGWHPRPRERFTPEVLGEQLRVVGRHRRLLGRMLEILAEDGVLVRAGEQWEVASLPVARPAHEQVTRLRARYPAAQPELELFSRCGAALASVLRGERDPLQLIFPGGDMSAAATLYGEAPSFRVMNQLVQEAVSAVLPRAASGRSPRVLEIGAGTGGTTSWILPKLVGTGVEYVFTDVSNAFLVKARERFQEYSFVRYQLLDIEREPEAQGFSAGQYDVVVASNVLHATKGLRQTLRHVRRLLAPGGTLVLLEMTERLRWADLTYGLTEGWWRFEDRDSRQAHPLLPAARWEALLRESGFGQATAIPRERKGFGIASRQAVLVARADQPLAEQGTPPGTWLILGDSRGVGRRLGDLLAARGEACTHVSAGARFSRTGEREYEIDVTRSEDLARLLREETAEGRSPRGIVYLWGLDSALEAEEGSSGAADVPRGALSLIQALLAAAPVPAPRVWLVTRGAVPAGRQPQVPGLAQAPLWGFGRILALEHPELWGGLVDLDPSAPSGEEARLLSELSSQGEEDQLAFREGQRFVARLVRRRRESPPPLKLRSDGAYLITGGLGFLGLRLARWMVEQGARHLVLVGRHGLPERESWKTQIQGPGAERIAAIQAMERLGATVEVIQADASVQAAMSRLLGRDAARFPAWRGIVHAAGIAGYRSLREETAEGMAAMLRPKVEGAWILHRLTERMPLDFFICFSSASSVWGARGHASYAAANAFLDALAHHRRAAGLPALTVNWALIGHGGMLPEGYGDWLAQIGVEELPPEEGFLAMGGLLTAGAVQTAVARVDWGRFKELYEARQRRRLLEEMEASSRQASPRPASRGSWWERLVGLPESVLATRLSEYVREQVTQTLGIGSRALELQRPLSTLGLDSLMAIQLRNQIKADLKVDIPMVRFMEEISAAGLVSLLSEWMAQASAARAPAGPGRSGQELGAAKVPPAAVEEWVEGEL